MLNIIPVQLIGWDLFWVLRFFLAVVAVVILREEDGMTNAEIVEDFVYFKPE